ncbi:MAG: XRE family transcriptional regulator [Cohnella sp.]|jgi:transcriptional regulator with XRE-family HTH domain|uniref:helix-turn-helix domain-containing protein n=1 Tax=Cohnella sp. TaxID=1883426 RepID=UPI000E3A80AF|nr:helix-turn-helix transcriptional regulator [Cohnella sp.]REK67900.1 MAG: XRE family transcriptional regulator [Cohnella sp.]
MADTFGKRLKQARHQKRMTQNEVADKLGIDFTTISKYENNKSQPDNDILREMASLYEVSLDWLLLGEQNGKSGEGAGNRIYVNGVQENLTDEEARYLLDSLEMFRLLKEKRKREEKRKSQSEGEADE